MENNPLRSGVWTTEFWASLLTMGVTVLVVIFGVPREHAQSLFEAIMVAAPAVAAVLVQGLVVWAYVSGRQVLKADMLKQMSTPIVASMVKREDKVPIGSMERVADALEGIEVNPFRLIDDCIAVLGYASLTGTGASMPAQIPSDAEAAAVLRSLIRPGIRGTVPWDALIPLIPVFADLLSRLIKRRRPA